MTANRVASLLIGPALVVASTLAPMLALGGQREGYRQQPDAAGCPGEPAEFYPCAQEKVRTFEPSRTPAGHPDLRGFWHHGRQNRIITDHPPTPGIRGETSIIVDPPNGEIPYQAWAEAKRAEVFELNQNPPSAEYIDPPARCISRGVPRQMYNSPPRSSFCRARTTSSSCTNRITPTRSFRWTAGHMRDPRLSFGWGTRAAAGKATRW